MRALLLKALVPVLAAALIGGGGYAYTHRDSGGITITAHFRATVGVYKGSSVRVLGVPVGKVTTLRPEGTTVFVRMQLRKGVRVPDTATAVVVPPSLVSDRYIQLTPAFTGGAALPDGADLPVERTRTPVELDEITSAVDRLLKTLGPEGVNKDGALSNAVSTGARVLKGNGAQLRHTLEELSKAVEAFANGKDDFASVVANLAQFTQTLADSDATVRQFSGDLASAATQLAEQRRDLGESLKNLSIALTEVGSLVKDHRSALVSDVGTLREVTSTLLAHERSLKEALDVLPLGVTNLGQAVNTNTPGFESLDIRQNNQQFDGDPTQIVLCQVLAPILGIGCPAVPTGSGSAPSVSGPGSTPGEPDLGLAALLGGRR